MDNKDLDMLINDFKLYFPFFYERAVDIRQCNTFEIIVTLDDGSMLYYDYLEKTFRMALLSNEDVGIGLTEERWKKEFAVRLRRRMNQKHITQKELSEMAGVSVWSISNYLNCKSVPSAYALRKIAKALDCSIKDLNIFMDI